MGSTHFCLIEKICAGNSFPHMVDVPLWPSTHYLLEGPSHAQMLALLDDVLAEDVEKRSPDLRQRALLQHELWEVFDWSLQTSQFDAAARTALRRKLAPAIRKLALTPAQIAALPDSLKPKPGDDGPLDVTSERDGWVCIGIPGATAVAPAHVRSLAVRSVFGVFMRLPDGREATIAYIRQLGGVPYSATASTSRPVYSTNVPQFPVGTKLGLLRRMLLIDRDGELVVSPITQSLQLRTFVQIRPAVVSGDVLMQEFTLDRERYLAGDATAMRPAENEPSMFMSLGIDWFEANDQIGREQYHALGPVVRQCPQCHGGPGVFSMNSFTRFFSTPVMSNPRIDVLDFDREAKVTIALKQEQASWGALSAYWEAEGR